MASPAEQLLDLLWARYVEHVPYAGTFVRLAGGDFRNDHVAFRSLQRPGSGLELFAPVFERLGWVRKGSYDFPDAKLDAIHLSHPDGLPRVFLSELRVGELSPRAQQIVAKLPADEPPPVVHAGPVPPSPLLIEQLAKWFRAPSAVVSSGATSPFFPRESDLLELEAESQYGAWMLLFGREVNHFTASVDDVESWAQRMASAGVPMKGDIEGEPGAGLRQTASKAAPRPVRALDGKGNTIEREWPYAYLEIAERNLGFDGFVAKQARQLFEMTKR